MPSEAEVLQHMRLHFARSGGSSGERDWVLKKADAIEAAHQKAGSGGIRSVLDLGIGDMAVLEAWPPFADVKYTGVDGCGAVIGTAAQRYKGHGGRREFILAPLSALVSKVELPNPNPQGFDAVLLLDVLPHIPDQQTHDRLLAFAFEARRVVVLSYCESGRRPFTAKKVGDPGFAWFPRPEVGELISTKGLYGGWDIVHEASGGPLGQRVVALVRSQAYWEAWEGAY